MEKYDVLVVGSGVAGLTVAHELAERDYRVLLLEGSDELGGKSRSIPFSGTESGGRAPLPGEHGFRFFPGFYRNLPETMARIPTPGGGTVADNLVDTSRTLALTDEGRKWELPNHMRSSAGDISSLAAFLYEALTGTGVGVPREDVLHYVKCILAVLTSCEERRFSEYENTPAWDFYQAEMRSREYQDYIVSTVTKSLVACRAKDMSARSHAVIGIQILLDVYRSCSDRVLNAPTNEAWITPWVDHLRSLGVDLRARSRVTKLGVDARRIAHVELESGERLSARYIIGAVPVEVMSKLVDGPMLAVAPSLSRLEELHTEWMSGVVFYLDSRIDGNAGHTIFMDSPWALTSIFQHQFWRGELGRYGKGDVRAVLSVCISDFNTPGVLHGKPAKRCSRQELQEEVWAQIVAHYRGEVREGLLSAKVLDVFVDPALCFGGPVLENDSPLLINTTGSWKNRPDTEVGFENFFLASDYVRTHADVATMESANEAGKRAANAVLEAERSAASRAEILPLEEPEFSLPFKALDRLRFEAGLPHILDVLPDFSLQTVEVLRPKVKGLLRRSDAAVTLLRGFGIVKKLPTWESRIFRTVSNWVNSSRPGAGSSPLVSQGATRKSAADGGGRGSSDEHLRRSVQAIVGGSGDPALFEDLSGLSARCFQGLQQTELYFRDYGQRHDEHHVDMVLGGFLSAPGKRLRALCTYLSASLLRRHLSDDVHAVAVIVESVHAASLLHDDIIDKADSRRGKPTVHSEHGVAAGVLAGDLLLSRAVQTLYQLERRDLADELFAVVDKMVAAEARQLSSRHNLELKIDDYFDIVEGKTSRLFSWACSAGARVNSSPPSWSQAVAEYGLNLGTAFQLTDDLLDLQREEQTGKTPLSDYKSGLLTHPVLCAREQAPQELRAAMLANDPSVLRAVLDRTGAVKQTQEEARLYVERAIVALKPIRYCAAKVALERLASDVASRSR